MHAYKKLHSLSKQRFWLDYNESKHHSVYVNLIPRILQCTLVMACWSLNWQCTQVNLPELTHKEAPSWASVMYIAYHEWSTENVCIHNAVIEERCCKCRSDWFHWGQLIRSSMHSNYSYWQSCQGLRITRSETCWSQPKCSIAKSEEWDVLSQPKCSVYI